MGCAWHKDTAVMLSSEIEIIMLINLNFNVCSYIIFYADISINPHCVSLDCFRMSLHEDFVR